jgi:hypothetical protein
MACTPGGDPLDLGELPPHYLLAAAGWTKAPAELIDVDENKSAGRQCLMGARQPVHGQAVFEKRRNQGDYQSTSEPTGAVITALSARSRLAAR